MAGAGGLAFVLLGGLIGFLLVLGAIGLVVYGFVTENARRGYIASLIALAISVVASLLSTPFWIVLLSGHGSHGEPVTFAEASPIYVLVSIEAFMMAASLLGSLRQRSRRKASG